MKTTISSKPMVFQLLVLLFTFLLTSCGDQAYLQENEENLQPLTKARKLLNNGEYDAAIAIFEEEIPKNPEYEVELKIELASAYGMKSGVDVYTLFPILKTEIFSQPLLEWGRESRTNLSRNPYQDFIDDLHLEHDQNNGPHDLRKLRLKRFYEFTWKIFKFSQYIYSIPHITEENRVSVREAILILDSIENNKTARTYLSFLSIIYLSSLIKDAFPSDIENYESYFCRIDLELIFDNTKRIGDIIFYLKRGVIDTQLDSDGMRQFLNEVDRLTESLSEGEDSTLSLGFEEFKEAICI